MLQDNWTNGREVESDYLNLRKWQKDTRDGDVEYEDDDD